STNSASRPTRCTSFLPATTSGSTGLRSPTLSEATEPRASGRWPSPQLPGRRIPGRSTASRSWRTLLNARGSGFTSMRPTGRQLGTRGLGRLIEQTNDLAAYLARRCAESDDFEALPAVPALSVVCFRHLPGGRAAPASAASDELDRHQDELQAALEASGDGWLS